MTPEQGATPRTNTVINVHGANHAASFGHLAGHARTLERELADVSARFAAFRLTASTDEEIRLRADLTAALSRAEAAEAKLAEMSKIATPADNLREMYAQLLAAGNLEIKRREAAEARAGRLYAALTESQLFLTGPLGYSMDDFMVKQNHEALADAPSNWLRDRLREERERCAKACETYGFHLGLHPMIRVSARNCAESIRALPEGE